MVDNINLNKISPLLSSTERVKRVDRRPPNGQQSQFKGDSQGKQKKKKKKKKGEDGTLSEATPSGGRAWNSEQVMELNLEKKKKSPADQSKKIIDIRV